MYDRQVRRRRAVLALLVVVSLILLTAYFGESGGGPFHAVQRGVIQVLSPVQDGASRALKPARDLFGWFGDTFHAKKQVGQLKKQVAAYRQQAVGYQEAIRQNAEYSRLLRLDASGPIAQYQRKTARIVGRSVNNLLRDTIQVNAGSGDGVRLDDAVVAGDGLVGHVSNVAGSTSVITLITDQSSSVQARVLSKAHATRSYPGLLKPSVGNPTDLLMQLIPRTALINNGDFVVTGGSRSGSLDPLYPPGILIGTVRNPSPVSIQTDQQVHVSPAVDLRRLDFVQILTSANGGAGGLRAQVP
ncbi:MAG: rod shape-determining protein MreC [Conexibacter sp.]|nr:rod shape-determining protein MreC [Conexibacter sp.]